jgi:Icc-related predicted phosphoesterase
VGAARPARLLADAAIGAHTRGSGRLGGVRVTVISDVHGAVEPLRAVAKECDVLVVLGDLLNVIDYRSMEGILPDILGREVVAAAAALRSRGLYAEARATIRGSGRPEADVRAEFAEMARRQYEDVLEVLPDGAVITYGNADIPDLLRSMVPTGVRLVDGEVLEMVGLRWGIVGGGAPTPLGIPGEVSEDVWERKLAALGSVHVIGTHPPPRIPWFCYDVVAEKFELGSTALVGYIVQRRPRYALFGHVHQPLVSTGDIGPTTLINVGHFRADGRGWTYDGAD